MSRLDEALGRLERAVARLEAACVGDEPKPEVAPRQRRPATNGVVDAGDEGLAGSERGLRGGGLNEPGLGDGQRTSLQDRLR
jgi:hypothetical protein